MIEAATDGVPFDRLGALRQVTTVGEPFDSLRRLPSAEGWLLSTQAAPQVGLPGLFLKLLQ